MNASGKTGIMQKARFTQIFEPMTPASISIPPTTPEQLFARLQTLAIDYTLYNHARVFTVAESEQLTDAIPGLHCRNLFLRDKRERMFLVVAGNGTDVDLKMLPELLGCGRLSFGSPERLWRHLGVRPGSVCPFAIINDGAQQVQIVLDSHMMSMPLVAYHPLENDRTVTLTPADLRKFIASCGHTPHIVDVSARMTVARGEYNASH